MFKKPEEKKEICELYSYKYFALCGAGGALACGITHTLITPLDIVKRRVQINPCKYRSLTHAFKVSVCEENARVLWSGWEPVCIGRALQGCVRFSAYEFFKYEFAQFVHPQTAFDYRTSMYMTAAACAELLAGLFLAPFEATKVRMQTTPSYSCCCYTYNMRAWMSQMWCCEGFGEFYRGLQPLWRREVPYTMVQFAAFERTIEYLYEHVKQKPRSECTTKEQLAVTYAAGFIAGVLGAIVSHPVNTILLKLNRNPCATIVGVIKDVDFLRMWCGLLPRITIMGPMAGAQWLIYDAFKVYKDIPRPEPAMDPKLKEKNSRPCILF